MASCFIRAHLDLIFKWRTEAESADAVTMATELIGHTHSNISDRTVCDAFVIAGGETGWCGRVQSWATQQTALGDERHLGSAAGLLQISIKLRAGEGRLRGGINAVPAFVITLLHLGNFRHHLRSRGRFICLPSYCQIELKRLNGPCKEPRKHDDSGQEMNDSKGSRGWKMEG